MTDHNLIWTPYKNTSQERVLKCPFQVILFSGTRGPGKSDTALIKFSMHCGRGYGEDWRGIVFAPGYKQLDEIKVKGKKLFMPLGVTFKESKSDYKFVWPTGEELLLRHAKTADDYWNYHGHEYPFILFEELTKWPKLDVYHAMFSLNRSTNKEMPRIFMATTNPYGAGHPEVKREWIDPSPELKTTGTVLTPFAKPLVNEFKPIQKGEKIPSGTFMFCGFVDGEWKHWKRRDTVVAYHYAEKGYDIYPIRGRISYWSNKNGTDEWTEIEYTDFSEANKAINDPDQTLYPLPPRIRFDGDIMENDFIVENDPEYIEKLESIEDEQLRKAWRFGSWEVNVGAYFHGYLSKENNMIAPFTPPHDWKRWRSYDFGQGKPWSIGYYAINPDGVIFRYRELYGWTGVADVGSGENWDEICDMMDEVEADEKKLGCKFFNNPADHNIFTTQGHEIDLNEKFHSRGYSWVKATKGSRVVGWALLKELFKNKRLMITSDCTNFWRTVPNLMVDEKNWEDIDTDGEDHIADEVRYSAVSRHMKTVKKIKEKPKEHRYAVINSENQNQYSHLLR